MTEGSGVPTSVRLDPKTEAVLRRLSEQTGRTKSAIIREAIERLDRELGGAGEPPTLYDQIGDLVGAARGGEPDLAARSEEILRERFPPSRPKG